MSANIYYRETPVREFDLNQTLYNTIFTQNEKNMDCDAIGFIGYHITFRELKNRVDQLADAYAKQGITIGSTVGICSICMPIVQENLLALSKLGATSLWIDLRNKEKDLINKLNESNCHTLVIFDGITPTIEKIINETDLKDVFIASPKDYLNPFIRILANYKDKQEGKFITIPKDRRFKLYKDFIKTGAKDSIIVPASFEKERPSIIVQSSGSTGVSKSIIHTEYNFNSEMQKEAYSDLPFMVGKSMYCAIPPFIIYGLNNSIYAALAFGMKAEMTPFVSEDTIYNDLGKFDVACGAPLHYRYIYKKLEELKEEIEELENKTDDKSKKQLRKTLNEMTRIIRGLERAKAFVSGGDSISSDELLRMQHRFNVPIVNGYGNNELAGGVVISPVYASKPNAVGIPLKGVEVKTFDPETEEPLKDGEVGEICFCSDSVFVEYLNNEEETKRIKKLHSDGKEWIHSGDLGYVDEDGFVYVIGRTKRLIKRAAFKIAPTTIEQVIIKVEGVTDCVVVGVPDEEELAVPMAYIEIAEGYDYQTVEKQIKTKLAEELPDYEIPAYYRQIDKIPYNNGKHDFKTLESLGKEYVTSKKLTYKN